MTNTKGLVYVQGPAYYNMTAKIFKDYGFDIVPDMKSADIIALTGGEDINPKWYNQKPLDSVYWDDGRDRVDKKAIDYGLSNNKFMVGICRGAQFLCVAQGGSLFQDVDGHNSGYHIAWDIPSKAQLELITVHHQMMRPTDEQLDSGEAQVITTAKEATYLADEEGIFSPGPAKEGWWGSDIETLWYPKTKSLCVQFHPEFGHKPSTLYFYDLMDRYYEQGKAA